MHNQFIFLNLWGTKTGGKSGCFGYSKIQKLSGMQGKVINNKSVLNFITFKRNKTRDNHEILYLPNTFFACIFAFNDHFNPGTTAIKKYTTSTFIP